MIISDYVTYGLPFVKRANPEIITKDDVDKLKEMVFEKMSACFLNPHQGYTCSSTEVIEISSDLFWEIAQTLKMMNEVENKDSLK